MSRRLPPLPTPAPTQPPPRCPFDLTFPGVQRSVNRFLAGATQVLMPAPHTGPGAPPQAPHLAVLYRGPVPPPPPPAGAAAGTPAGAAPHGGAPHPGMQSAGTRYGGPPPKGIVRQGGAVEEHKEDERVDVGNDLRALMVPPAALHSSREAAREAPRETTCLIVQWLLCVSCTTGMFQTAQVAAGGAMRQQLTRVAHVWTLWLLPTASKSPLACHGSTRK